MIGVIREDLCEYAARYEQARMAAFTVVLQLYFSKKKSNKILFGSHIYGFWSGFFRWVGKFRPAFRRIVQGKVQVKG